MYALLLLLCGGQPADLGHPDYPAREAAECRLRDLGPLAWPALLDRLGDESPEVRQRAWRALLPYRRLCDWAEAANVLVGETPPEPWELFPDERLRLNVCRLAVAAGVPAWQCGAIHPSADPRAGWGWPWNMLPAWRGMADEVEACRRFFREGVEAVPLPRESPY
jgi:hypothetical protein